MGEFCEKGDFAPLKKKKNLEKGSLAGPGLETRGRFLYFIEHREIMELDTKQW